MDNRNLEDDSINHQTLTEFHEVKIKDKSTLKGVSTVVVKTENKHDDYVNVIETNKTLKQGSRVDQKLQPPTLHHQATEKTWLH